MKKNKYKYEFDWHLTDACNFNCVYCHPQIAEVKNRKLPYRKSTEEIAESFNKLGGNCHIFMSGGEPFLYPNFVKLCKLLIKGGNYIGINTNFSIKDKIKKFAYEIDPKYITGIYASLHILERERLGLKIDDFIEDCLLFQKKKFPFTVYYVMYPPLLNRFKRDCEFLLKSGIKNIACKLFKGFYKGKKYPDSYTMREKKLITTYKWNKYKYTKAYLNKETYEVKNKLCRAGVTFFKIEVDGRIHRCPADEEDFGNIFQGTFRPKRNPYPCRVNEGLSLSQCKANIVNL